MTDLDTSPERRVETLGLDRRGFLRRLGATALVSPLAVSVLAAACAPAPATPASPPSAVSGSASGGKLQLPTYVPFQGPKPDLPASADGLVPPGYLSFPSNLATSVPQAPGHGGDVNVLVYSVNPPPPAVDQNPAWQAVNKALNVNLQIPIITDYSTRLSTVLASGDIPDVFLLWSRGVVGFPPNLDQFLSSACADLTPYLAGDAIKAYPNLANLPPYVWPPAVFGNRLAFVPVARGGITGQVMITNQTLLDSVGAGPINSADDFLRVAKQVTIPLQRYAIGGTFLTWLTQIFGAPNDWSQAGGTFTKDIETPQYKAAVAYARSLWDQGFVHPDSLTLGLQANPSFSQGKFAFWVTNVLFLNTAWDRALAIDPTFKLRAVTPFAADGTGKGVHYLGTGAVSLAVIKQASADRVKEMLGILNYLSAPFGTREALLLQYGVEGTDFSFDAKGNPVPTQQGQKDLFVPWRSLAAMPDVLYDPLSPDFATAMHQNLGEILPLGVKSATVGLYSKTDAQKGPVLTQNLTDGLNQIVFGKADVNTFDGLVADWRRNGGDQIRAEYQQALQDAGK